jgi:hypothetical protein
MWLQVARTQGKVTGQGDPNPLELTAPYYMSQLADIEPQGLVPALLVSILLCPIPPFSNGHFTLCHCILEVCTFLFYFTGLTTKSLP